MRASTSTSEPRARARLLARFALGAILAACALAAPPALAAEPASPGGKTGLPEEDDFGGTPFTEYGEFNEESDEEADAKFFAHGRFFGASLGVGYEGVDGNRGVLWQGGFPLVDFKLHYWFDFNFALDLGGYVATHAYDTSTDQGGHVDVSMIHLGVDFKYYFDTKNLSAAISFANPYLQAGFGSYSKTETSEILGGEPETDTGIGLSVGAGLEFALQPKKVYLELEARYHLARFKDTNTARFRNANGIDDLTGNFYTFNTNLLFTW